MKALRCKVGDLCVVVKARSTANLGRIVRVVAPYSRELDDFPMESADWMVECSTTLTWKRPPDKRWRRKKGPVPDECLLPIRGSGAPGDDAATKAPSIPAPKQGEDQYNGKREKPCKATT